MKNQEVIVSRLEAIEAKLAEFTSGNIINLLEDNAQKGSGAENRESKSTN
jgi:hypothetical protein